MSALTMPSAPLTQIYVVLRRMKVSGEVHGILPYIDIPNSAKNEQKFAFILASGSRGTIGKKLIEEDTKSCGLDAALDKALRRNNWDPIYIKWGDVDFKKHFANRKDDGIHDPVSESLFKDLNDWVTCMYCGHPNEGEREECEACETMLVVTIEMDIDAKGFDFKTDEWA
tara:strand:+ start:3668 stop:4177 length:510 start_codon:yes stop_codon:yes gene_type:complete